MISVKRYNILITSVGSTTSIGVIKFIRNSHYNSCIIGTDSNPKHKIAGSALVDKFYTLEVFNHKNYLMALKKIIKENNIEILIPIHDKEIEILADVKAEFAKMNCKIIVSLKSTVDNVNDKYLFFCTLTKSGIKTPPTFLVNEWLIEQIHDVEKKWILKPIKRS